MNKNIPILIIRADADSTIGTGHVMRCIALAQQWRNMGGQVKLIGNVTAPQIVNRLKKEGVGFFALEHSGQGKNDDLRQTMECIEKNDIEKVVVLDGYGFGIDYCKSIQIIAKLMVVDDYYHQERYQADFLLNQNIGAENISYSINPDATLLLGTHYTLIRKEFLKAKKPIKSPAFAKRILITAGGADPKGLSMKVLHALIETGRNDWSVNIIAGPANKQIDEIKQLVSTCNFKCHVEIATEEMPRYMSWADMAISAAGSTCWELALMGVASIVFAAFENQIKIATGLHDAQAARSLGWVDHVSLDTLSEEIFNFSRNKELREKIVKHSLDLVDGRGSNRIIKVLCGDLQ